MSADHETLEPTPFEAAPAAPAAAAASAATATPRWLLPALGGLLLLALLVVFWLPRQVSPPAADAQGQPAAEADSQASPAARGSAKEAPPEASPWSDAQAAKLRKEAQDVLQELLELQFALQEQGAEQWAGEAYKAASETAAKGDELYRQREYTAAKDHYQQSLEAFQGIADSGPEIVDQQLQLARQGIEALTPEPVDAALALAELIEPENAELAKLKQRAANLEALAALMNEAATAENSGDLALAEQQLQQATALDAQHEGAAAELARVSAAYIDQQFNDAMSDGYNALDEGRYSQAREQFRRAAKLQAGSEEAASALREVASTEQASRLQRLKGDGSRYEQAEQWQQAVAAYEKAASIDSDVLFAAEGLQRSRARARLDTQFKAAIDKPERLSDVAVAEATAKLLQQARNISPRGPVLEQQISRLDTLLAQANTLVPVTFRSDEQTEVIIYKVARLGRFQQRELTLRPGTYKVRGSRNGYRDVLESITISHQGAPTAITIACREPIN
jgi:tetratricopeptide (TPR) repeat protein